MWMLLVLAGCGSDADRKVVNEEEEPGFRRARQLLREGRKEEALNDFLRLIQYRAEAPESHLEAAQLYLHDFKQPLKAYYHFDRFLELRPHSSNANLVRGQLQAARREFIRTLPGNVMSGQLDRIELSDQVESLVAENETLKKQLQVMQAELELARRTPPPAPLASQPPSRAGDSFTGWDQTGSGELTVREPASQVPVSSQPTSQPQPFVPPASNNQPAQPTQSAQQALPVVPTPAQRARVYEVVRGDTLSNISRKVYGHPSGWEKIFNANRDQLPNQNSLRPGQVLRIPPE